MGPERIERGVGLVQAVQDALYHLHALCGRQLGGLGAEGFGGGGDGGSGGVGRRFDCSERENSEGIERVMGTGLCA